MGWEYNQCGGKTEKKVHCPPPNIFDPPPAQFAPFFFVGSRKVQSPGYKKLDSTKFDNKRTVPGGRVFTPWSKSEHGCINYYYPPMSQGALFGGG